MYAYPNYAVIGRGIRADMIRLTRISNTDDRRDFDEDFYHDDYDF